MLLSLLLLFYSLYFINMCMHLYILIVIVVSSLLATIASLIAYTRWTATHVFCVCVRLSVRYECWQHMLFKWLCLHTCCTLYFCYCCCCLLPFFYFCLTYKTHGKQCKSITFDGFLLSYMRVKNIEHKKEKKKKYK